MPPRFPWQTLDPDYADPIEVGGVTSTVNSLMLASVLLGVGAVGLYYGLESSSKKRDERDRDLDRQHEERVRGAKFGYRPR